MTPDYRRDNPYQELLARALEDLGMRVSFPRGYRRVLPLRRMLRQDGAPPDLLHLHWIAPYLKGRSAAAKALYAGKLVLDVALVRRAGVRVAWTVHNLVEHEQAHPGIELWCRRRLARMADSIIVHSERARELVAASYGAPVERIFVIPHGHYRDVYGTPVSAKKARTRLSMGKAGQVFLYFGMIRPYKGVPKLLAVWAENPKLHARHTLVIAGEPADPGLEEEIRNMASRLGSVRLRLERIPDVEVSDYFSAADVVVAPFDQVLTSGSLLLAHSYGRRVVRPENPALDLPGLERATVSYRPEDPAGLATALMTAAEEGGRDQPFAERQALPGWHDVARSHSMAMDPCRSFSSFP